MIDSLQFDRERERHTLDRLASFVDLVTGARITYKQLKGDKAWFDADSLAQEM